MSRPVEGMGVLRFGNIPVVAIFVLPAIQVAQLVHAGERAGEVGLHHFARASVRAGYDLSLIHI